VLLLNRINRDHHNKSKYILLTGSSGFLGSNLLVELANVNNLKILALVRNQISCFPSNVQSIVINSSELFSTNLPLMNVDVIIHCAGRAHVMNDSSSDPLSEFRKVNVEGTLNLARQAAKAGVKRFIFISSIKVNGESSTKIPISIDQAPDPQDPYAVSKFEAEQGLKEVCSQTGMEYVIIRPPLIYGAGVKGNLSALCSLIKKRVPLPFGSVRNRRSFVSLGNLCDLIVRCVDHPQAANCTFLVSDDEAISTSQLIRYLAKGLDVKLLLLPVPVSLMQFGATMLGKKVVADRLLGNFEIDISYTKKTLGWSPPYAVSESFHRMFNSD
jgi:nucleoside-diphosphate-sugar epimerase